MQPIIRLEHVFFAYREMLVLQDIDVEIQAGEFVGIIGPNGGGKTTMLKLMMGFLSPLSGVIEIFGVSPKRARCEMAYVPQSLRFDRQFPISVSELVLTGRLAHLPWYGIYGKEDWIAVEKALEQVGLTDFRSAAFGELSGGQAQRALIARALVSHPKLLFLDEPTASVDSEAEADIYAILKNLRGDMTILMVTHDLKTAIDQVGRVLCVQNTLRSLDPKEVCEHFAFGLYHTPLLKIEGSA